LSEVDHYGSLDSKEALEIAAVWDTYMRSWRTDKQLSELFETLKSQHATSLAAGQFSAVHNSIYRFIEEVGLLGAEGDSFLEAAEFLTKQLLDTGNLHAASAINSLTFRLMIPVENYARAEHWLIKAVNLEAGDQSENALNNLAIGYSMQGQEEKAIALFLRSWGFSTTDYKPEAMYHIAHLVGSCANDDFTRTILHEVTQAPDTDYAKWAQNCLWGQCGSTYKPSLNSFRNTIGTKELLRCSDEDYLTNLFPRIDQLLSLLDEAPPIDAVELDIEKFESPKFTLEHVEQNGQATDSLIEFAQVHSLGNLKLHRLAMSLVLYGQPEANFSSLACILLAEWSRGNLPNPNAVGRTILAQENFLPAKQPLVNYAIQESLLSGMRSKADFVEVAQGLICWEASHSKAIAGFPMLGIMQSQAEDGDLTKFASELSEYCNSDYPQRYKDTTSVIPLLANQLLTFLMADGNAYLNFDGSKAIASVAQTLEFDPASDQFLFLLSETHQFLDRRLSMILGTPRDSEFGRLSADDIYFLALTVLAISSKDLRGLVEACAGLKARNLVSKSIFPLVDKIAILAWARGAIVNWSDENLNALEGLIHTVGNSESLTDIVLMWENAELKPLIEVLDSPLAQVVRRTGLMALELEALEELDTKSLLTLCGIRSMPEKFYKFAMKKVPIEGVAVLATNPDAFEIVHQQLLEKLPVNDELAYVAASTFVKDQSLDWPRSLPKVLSSMINPRGLALLAGDHRLQDGDLQVIAAKADKKIATLLKEHPNASDETKALAQLVA